MDLQRVDTKGGLGLTECHLEERDADLIERPSGKVDLSSSAFPTQAASCPTAYHRVLDEVLLWSKGNGQAQPKSRLSDA